MKYGFLVTMETPGFSLNVSIQTRSKCMLKPTYQKMHSILKSCPSLELLEKFHMERKHIHLKRCCLGHFLVKAPPPPKNE